MREKKWVLTLTATLVILGGLLALMWETGFFQSLQSIDSLQAYIRRWAPYSHLIFFLVQFASVVVAPIPSNITAAAGAVLFGTIQAFLLTVAAVFAGSILVFGLARGLGQSFVDGFMSERMSERYLSVFRNKRDSFLILAFLFPFFPDDLLCILAGLTDISFRRFALLVILARPWGLLVACAVGGSTLYIPWWGIVMLGVAGVVLFVLGMKYGDRIENKIIARLREKKKSK